MADIILKDGTGTPQTFENVASITVPKSGGGTAKFSAVSGNIHITQNGAGIDVSSYETASVSVSAGGGSNIDFGVSVGDMVDAVFFNTIHDRASLDAMLAAASYPNSTNMSGITLLWNKLLIGAVGSEKAEMYIGDLSSLQADTYIIYVINSGMPYIMYSTKAFDASSIVAGMVVTAGWQVSKFAAGVAFEITYILEDFMPIKDNYIAKSLQAYGESEQLELQDKTVTPGSAAPTAIIPDAGYNGLSTVSLALDESVIKPTNIKSEVTILGVQGSMEGLNRGAWYMSHASTNTGDGYFSVIDTITTVGTGYSSMAYIFGDTLKSWYNEYGNKAGSLIIMHSSSGHKVGDKFNVYGWAT